MQASPHRLVETLQDRFAVLETEFSKAYWDSQIEATDENDRRREAAELVVRQAKGDPSALSQVDEALEGGVHDAVLQRQLEVLRLSLMGNQMGEQTRARIVSISSSVESDFASFRPVVDGKRVSDNELEEILRTSDEGNLRRDAWEASKEIGGVVAARIRELARLRNSAAHNLGFADFYTMSLELQELTEEWLFSLLDEVDRLTADPFRSYKQALDEQLARRFGTGEIHPWHYADPFFQSLPPDGRITLDEQLAGLSAPAVAERTFAGWGIDISGVLAGSDLYPRERKCQHAFCLDVDRSGKDVRILANVVDGERWIETMLHESGHAAYDVRIDPHLPYLLRRPAHTFVTESIAILCGRLVHDPRWLTDIGGLPAEEVERISEPLLETMSAQSLLFARWVLVMTHFERALYSDPEADLDVFWWELVSRYQLVAPPPGRRAPDWAAKIHVAVAPVYYHNYLLGEILASQLQATCQKECGGLVGVPEAGRLLEERVFKHGALMRWDVLVEQATAKPLSAADFVASITGG
jgi:peptidyl-dipeptidase A